MNAPVVFVGPSLPSATRARLTGFDWRPPAGAGDLLALIEDPPETVCLIDGYFDARPAPWHKEILLLMEAGTRVLGAASMGALRAAELAPFGMEGVGAIFRAYRDGRLTGDDEVALAHAEAELGWQPLSEPMVEVRATLAACLRAGHIDGGQARTMRAAARAIDYRERDWRMILESAGLGQLEPEWLRPSIVRLKQIDALECLQLALTSRRPAHRPIVVPVTCFVEALASERGVRLPPRPAPPMPSVPEP